jgi:hypothetical protein
MRWIAFAIIVAALAATAQSASKDDAERLLKAARNTETVDGDLNGAIRQYQAIVTKYAKTDRAVTSMALVREAECRQKIGDAEARRIYDRVVRDYARSEGSRRPGASTSRHAAPKRAADQHPRLGRPQCELPGRRLS